jgi:hypothetical protein
MGAGMPSRWLRWLIILFWLATTSWLFWHDLRPQWLPGNAPALLPDDVDEVHSPTQQSTPWTVLRQKEGKTETIFRAITKVEYNRDDDTYTLHADLKALPMPKAPEVHVGRVFRIDGLKSEYRVDRAGRLHALEAKVTVTPQFPRGMTGLFASFLPPRPSSESNDPPPVTLTLSGEVRGDQFFARCFAEGLARTKPLRFDLPPATLSHTGSVLMPMHPINHLRGLYPGRSWRQPLVDPLRDAFPGLSGGVRWLNARVLSSPQPLRVNDNETSCWVIEYTNDENEMVGRTWVERDSDRVLQQEAILDDGHWIMKRELERRSGRQRGLEQ